MPRRDILTTRQKSALFDLPSDQASLLYHYTLGDDDLEHINHRRRDENRLGFALQLCALRYPGRMLAPGEIIPNEALKFIGAQIGPREVKDCIEATSKKQVIRHSSNVAFAAIEVKTKRLKIA